MNPVKLARRRKYVSIYFVILALVAGIPGLFVSYILLSNAQKFYDERNYHNPWIGGGSQANPDLVYWYTIVYAILIFTGFSLLPGYCYFLKEKPNESKPLNHSWILSLIYNIALLCFIIFEPLDSLIGTLVIFPPALLAIILPAIGAWLSFLCLDTKAKPTIE